jgi:ubiquinone/menaquinone biosynthesis C-methylase UbiE
MWDTDPESNEQSLLEEQARYYSARAKEYDKTSSRPRDPFAADMDRARATLREFEPRGRVLELAAGTGQWTGLLAEYASELMAVDTSPEMLNLNAEKTKDPRVRYVVSDIFALTEDGAWDVIFFGFWLSHVPPGRFVQFWDLVAGLLAPGGRVFFVDEAAHAQWDEDWLDEAAGIVRRTLADGSEFRAIKVLWRLEQLVERLRGLGWETSAGASGPFLWGHSRRTSEPVEVPL